MSKHSNSLPSLTPSSSTLRPSASASSLGRRNHPTSLGPHHGIAGVGSMVQAQHTVSTDVYLAQREEASKTQRGRPRLPVHAMQEVRARGPSVLEQYFDESRK